MFKTQQGTQGETVAPAERGSDMPGQRRKLDQPDATERAIHARIKRPFVVGLRSATAEGWITAIVRQTKVALKRWQDQFTKYLRCL